jgi:DNA mismatch repair protein MutS
VEASILDAVVALYPGTFARLRDLRVRHAAYADDTVIAIERETQFCLACREFVTRLGGIGLPFCFPVVSAGSKEVSVRRCVDLALADKVQRAAGVVLNDLHLRDPERILVVSGPNQGGKTTFARMVGQLHHLAGAGLPVPGTAARLPLSDRIFTHFATEQNAATAHGRLEDELMRLHGILEQATPRSVLILNEMLSSASLQDALLLAGKIMGRVVRLDLLCICVTFLDELSRLGATTVSLVSTVADEDGVTRRFRVARRPADGAAYAASIAARHGLTYEQLRDRVRP